MFRENLLESSPTSKKKKRWPMAAAFSAELIVAALLALVPLLTTGVISVSAHVSQIAPLGNVRVAKPDHSPANSAATIRPSYSVVTLADNRHHAISISSAATEVSDASAGPDLPNVGIPNGLPNLPIGGNHPIPVTTSTPRHVIVSDISEGQLLKRVDPVYPRIAVVIHLQGEVKLHAIIARDGTIKSLTVVSGQPILASAAVEAVKQWRYRPYYLNGQPVEVETFITVSFKGIRD